MLHSPDPGDRLGKKSGISFWVLAVCSSGSMGFSEVLRRGQSAVMPVSLSLLFGYK